MSIDNKLVMFNAQAITGANKLSTILDLGDIENLGKGTQKYIVIDVDTIFTEDTSGEYLRIDLVASSGADPATSDKVREIIPSTAVSGTSKLLSVGRLERFAIPKDALDGLDHVGVAVIVTSVLAAGKLTAYVDI